MGLGGRQRPCRMPASGRIAQDFGLFRREVPFKTPSNETSGAAFGSPRRSFRAWVAGFGSARSRLRHDLRHVGGAVRLPTAGHLVALELDPELQDAALENLAADIDDLSLQSRG